MVNNDKQEFNLNQTNEKQLISEEKSLQPESSHEDEIVRVIANISPFDDLPTKKMNRLNVIAFGYLCVTTYSAYSSSSATALIAGGLNVFFWGLLITVFCNLCAAASLAEPASIYPFGNQASWCFALLPKSIRKPISYYVQWFFLLGYTLLGISGSAILSQLLLAMIQLTNPSFSIKSYQFSLCMNGFTIFATIFGIFGGAKLLANANVFSLIWNLSGFVVISIFMLVQSRGNYNSPEEAFVQVVNESGWKNSFIPWVSGLSQAALSTTAFDALAHSSAEMKSPHKDLPIGMVSAIGINGFIGLLYALIFIFCLPPNAQDLLSSPSGSPFAQFLFNLSKGSHVGVVFLILIFFIPFLITTVDLFTTASRIACMFAHQGGLPNQIGKVNKRYNTPIFAFIFVAIIDVGLAWINVGSIVAFQAFISAPTVILGWTYASVAACMLFYGRPKLNVKTPFSLGKFFGPLANSVTIIFNLCITVFLSLPPFSPVTPTSMNYTSVILFATLVTPIFSWFFYARKHYHGMTQ